MGGWRNHNVAEEMVEDVEESGARSVDGERETMRIINKMNGGWGWL